MDSTTQPTTTTTTIEKELNKMTINEHHKQNYKLDVTKDLFSALEEEKINNSIVGRKKVFIIFNQHPKRSYQRPYFLGECRIDEKEDNLDIVKQTYSDLVCSKYWKIKKLPSNAHVVFEYFCDTKGYIPYETTYKENLPCIPNCFCSVYIKVYACYCPQENHNVYFERKNHTNNVLFETW